MEISAEIKQTHQELSVFNADFLEYVKENPLTLKSSISKSLELQDTSRQLQAWPTFIKLPLKERFHEAHINVFNLIKELPRRMFDCDPGKISDYYEIPVKLAKIQLESFNEKHGDHLAARGDFIFSSSGLKCLEYNISVKAYNWYLPRWESLYLNIPVISDFLKKYQVRINNKNLLGTLLAHVTASIRYRIAHDDNEINIALVIPRFTKGDRYPLGLYLNKLYKDVLQKEGKHLRLKGNIFMCDYPHLTTTNGDMYYESKKIHAVIEMYNGLVSPQVMKSFKSGKLYLLNGPVTALLSNKLNLALLSDYERVDIFTREEKEIIEKYIPWTRKLVPGATTYGREKTDLERFVLSNREKLVIKIALGFGGKCVYIGKNTPGNQWENLVKTSMARKNYVVQEYVESPVYMYRSGENGYALHHAVWGFYTFGNTYGGTLLRILPVGSGKGIINSYQGAEISVVFEVDK